MRIVARLFLRVSSVSAHGSGRDHSFGRYVLTHSIVARSVFVLHGHRFCRDIAVVLIASIAIWIPDILLFFYVKLETGDSQDLKYGVYRIIGSGAMVQSVSRCLLVTKTATPLFHDGMKKLQRWIHLISE